MASKGPQGEILFPGWCYQEELLSDGALQKVFKSLEVYLKENRGN